jgi:hypothetical protein
MAMTPHLVSVSRYPATLSILGVFAGMLLTSTMAQEAAPHDPPAGTYDHTSISCGSGTTTVAGRVIYRTVGGEIRPLTAVRFTLSTHGTVHCSPKPVHVPLRQDSQGRFSLPVTLWSDSIEYYKGEQLVSSRSVDDKGTLLLKAKGCEPITVEFDDAWVAHDLEMSCPQKQ